MDMMKKKLYWTTSLPVDSIDYQLPTNFVVETDILKVNIYNYDYIILCLKYPDYVMQIMADYPVFT